MYEVIELLGPLPAGVKELPAACEGFDWSSLDLRDDLANASMSALSSYLSGKPAVAVVERATGKILCEFSDRHMVGCMSNVIADGIEQVRVAWAAHEEKRSLRSLSSGMSRG